MHRVSPRKKNLCCYGSLLIFISCLSLTLILPSILPAAQVTVGWDASDEAGVAGYKVYYGEHSRTYTKVMDVGLQTQCTLKDMIEGKIYYLAATAYDVAGIESEFSEELVFTVPRLDADGDGLTDQEESDIYNTDPNKADTDGDGISDGDEKIYWGDAWNADFDSDGVINLLDADSDNDGYLDGNEIDAGSDPGNNLSRPQDLDSATMYEDAEDGSIMRWHIYDDYPSGAVVLNVYDDEHQSRVIQLQGSGIDNGFQLLTDKGEPWHNAWQHIVAWSIKANEDFQIFIDVDTTAGHRYLFYTPLDHDNLGTGEYVHHGLGEELTAGTWVTVARDLQKDLEDSQPDAMILEVNGFLVRGNVRVDDIMLLSEIPIDLIDRDGDGLADIDEINVYGTNPQNQDSDADGINDLAELNYWGSHWNDDPDQDNLVNLLDPDSDNDGYLDGEEITGGYDPADADSNPCAVSSQTLYEDAEDGTTSGWSVYDNTPRKAQIRNVYDSDRDSRVIEVQGKGTKNGYQLRNPDGSNWNNTSQFVSEWSIKSSHYYQVFIDVTTTAGQRYLYYAPENSDYLGTGKYVHHGLGTAAADGTWKTYRRNLQADLAEAQPGVRILAVNGFLIRGDARLDDITLSDFYFFYKGAKSVAEHLDNRSSILKMKLA